MGGSAILGLLIGMLSAVSSVLMVQPASANGVALSSGDVLADVGGGMIKHLTPTGTLLDTLNTTTGTNEGDGMCFDSSTNLYATQGFVADTVSKFDAGGNLVSANFGSGYTGHPESCVVDGSGHIYVGQPDGDHKVLEFDSSGALLNSFAPAIENRGTDWIDLAKDQCTLQYTSEGNAIKQFNVCTNTQLPDFATGLPGPCYAHRILADGSDLVACSSIVEHLSPSGTVLKSYTPGGSLLFALNLDPDGTTFWTADYFTGQIWRINIATGAVVTSFTVAPTSVLGGLAVVGELTAAQPKLALTPATQSHTVGQSATVDATLTAGGSPVSGKAILFSVSGANSASGMGTTDPSGQASFSYTGTNTGSDTVSACYDANSNGVCDTGEATATAAVTWTHPAGAAPVIEDSSNLMGFNSVTDIWGVTASANDLVVAYVAADGPKSGGQSITVSGSGLTWNRVAQENGALGDSEVWVAKVGGTGKVVKPTAKISKSGFTVILTDVSYKNAPGIGVVGTFTASSGQPTGSVTTTQDNSWVWAVGNDWLASKDRTPGPGQTILSQNTDTAGDTYWVQSTTVPTPTAGTSVTINDTAPTTDPYNLVLIEIL